MTIYSAAKGTVVSAPTRVSTEAGSITALVLRDTSAGDAGVEYEVCCTDAPLGGQVLDHVKVGDHLVVVGSLRLDLVAGPLEDNLSAARVTLLAEAVGLDL